MTTTTSRASQNLINSGRLVMTAGIRDWISTGVEPWNTEPNPDTLSFDWRQHYIQVIILSTIEGSQGDTCDEDYKLNREVFENAGCGGRIVCVWKRNGASKILCICDDWGGANAITTIMFANEY